MRNARRALIAAVTLLAPILFVYCPADSPSSNPFPQPGTGGGGGSTNLPRLRVVASRADINANGTDQALVTGTATRPDGSAFPGQQILWEVVGQNFAGSPGTLSTLTSTTNGAGQGTTILRAPKLEFVPVGAFVIVTGRLVVANNPQGSPKASASIILRPKGTAPPGSGDSGGGTLFPPPTITTVAPNAIKVDANPAITVLVTGNNFTEGAQVLIVSSDGVFTVPAAVLSVSQLRFSPPPGLRAGSATIFVSGQGNTLSNGFGVTLTTGTGTGTEGPVSPAISAILPNSGAVNTTFQVVILGSNFSIAAGCALGGGVTFVGATLPLDTVCPSAVTEGRLTLTAPRATSTQSGPVDVFVTNDDGKISNTVSFTYTSSTANLPVINALSPSSGPTLGGTTVTVSGANFSATDQVVFASGTINAPASDTCAVGGPLCVSGQCTLSEARGACTINGTLVANPFQIIGSGQIQIITPNVSTNGAGPTDVFIRTTSGLTSNIATFNYLSAGAVGAPVITSLSPGGLFGDGCCGQGFQFNIFGRNFRQCSSVIFVWADRTYEVLPTPDTPDCAIQRGTPAEPSPQTRLISLLPPDGGTINCGSRPDYVPMASLGGGIYSHSQICYNPGAAPSAYSPLTGTLVNGVTNGGAVQWINEGQIRVLFAPQHLVPCESESPDQVYVQNDPGRGLAGDQVSNAQTFTITNTADCTGTGGNAAVTQIVGTRSACNALGVPFFITGSDLSSPLTVEFGFGNAATVTSVSGTRIDGFVPRTDDAPFPPGTPCTSFANGPGGVCPCTCDVPVIVTVAGQTLSNLTYTYTSNDSTSCQ